MFFVVTELTNHASFTNRDFYECLICQVLYLFGIPGNLSFSERLYKSERLRAGFILPLESFLIRES